MAFQLALSAFPPPQFCSRLKNQQPGTVVKTSGLATYQRSIKVLNSFKASF